MLKAVAILVVCGFAAAFAGSSRIVGGNIAPTGSFKYIASIRLRDQHFCGGSIVNPTTILTAAHCFNGNSTNYTNYTVVVGTTKLNAGGFTYPISKVIKHEYYNPESILNDIAIVKLARPISYNNFVAPVALATDPTPAGKPCTLSGWGLTSFPSNNYSNELKFLNSKTIDRKTCADIHANTSTVSFGHVCATPIDETTGACIGDSGGPLIVAGVQIGLLSWGKPCAKGYPDVYTSVSYYRNWISKYE